MNGDGPSWQLCRVCVTAEADLGSIARVLERFQPLHVLPRRVVAEFGVCDLLSIEVDIAGVAIDRLTLIVAKLSQVTSIINVHWHYM